MKLVPLLFLALVCRIGWAANDNENGDSNVVDLTDETFEHLTQASTGSTTGDWLIEFYAPWCGHCQRLAPIYDEVGRVLKGEVNVAKVDVTSSPLAGDRFSIKSFPTIKFLRKGSVYDYNGPRTKDSLIQFARDGYQQVEGQKIPVPPTMIDRLRTQLVEGLTDLQVVFQHKLAAAVIIFAFGLLLGVLFTTLVVVVNTSSQPAAPRHVVSRTVTTTVSEAVEGRHKAE
eukprot:GILJ01004826.1.p1 GENE.GILJ01004826.1~~GILJ01004826.1.p1  ORF type:complete len:239 (+),score=20.50 GILJ01004826.1:33-719(+)